HYGKTCLHGAIPCRARGENTRVIFHTFTRRSVIVKIATAMSLLMLACSAGIPVQFPRYPAGQQGERLKTVLKGKRRVAVVARELPENIKASFSSGFAAEWQDTTRGAVKKAFEKKGFYDIVDVDSRN